MMSLLDDLQQAEAEEQQSALALYREILLRSDRPEPTDAKRLRKAMAALGKTAADLKADLAVLRQGRELTASVQRWTTEQADLLHATRLESIAHADEMARVVGELEATKTELQRRIVGLAAVQERADRDRDKLLDLHARHPELLGDASMVPPLAKATPCPPEQRTPPAWKLLTAPVQAEAQPAPTEQVQARPEQPGIGVPQPEPVGIGPRPVDPAAEAAREAIFAPEPAAVDPPEPDLDPAIAREEKRQRAKARG